MARHFGELTDAEYQQFVTAFIDILKQFDVAGSIATHYSLYRMLEDARADACTALLLTDEVEDLGR